MEKTLMTIQKKKEIKPVVECHRRVRKLRRKKRVVSLYSKFLCMKTLLLIFSAFFTLFGVCVFELGEVCSLIRIQN